MSALQKVGVNLFVRPEAVEAVLIGGSDKMGYDANPESIVILSGSYRISVPEAVARRVIAAVADSGDPATEPTLP